MVTLDGLVDELIEILRELSERENLVRAFQDAVLLEESESDEDSPGWDTLIDLATRDGFEVREGWFPVADMAAADEAFTSSSVREVMPIVSLDARPVGDGSPGTAASTLQASLRRMAGA